MTAPTQLAATTLHSVVADGSSVTMAAASGPESTSPRLGSVTPNLAPSGTRAPVVAGVNGAPEATSVGNGRALPAVQEPAYDRLLPVPHNHSFGTPCHTRCRRWGRLSSAADWFPQPMPLVETSRGFSYVGGAYGYGKE